jgi:hypothetical protein
MQRVSSFHGFQALQTELLTVGHWHLRNFVLLFLTTF